MTQLIRGPPSNWSYERLSPDQGSSDSRRIRTAASPRRTSSWRTTVAHHPTENNDISKPTPPNRIFWIKGRRTRRSPRAACPRCAAGRSTAADEHPNGQALDPSPRPASDSTSLAPSAPACPTGSPPCTAVRQLPTAAAPTTPDRNNRQIVYPIRNPPTHDRVVEAGSARDYVGGGIRLTVTNDKHPVHVCL